MRCFRRAWNWAEKTFSFQTNCFILGKRNFNLKKFCRNFAFDFTKWHLCSQNGTSCSSREKMGQQYHTLISADQQQLRSVFAVSVWRAYTHAHLLYFCFTFRFRSVLWIYFAMTVWQNRGENKTMTLRCNFGCVHACGCLCQMYRNRFYQCEAYSPDWQHNRKNRNCLHQNSGISNLYLVYYIKRKFTASSLNVRRSRLRSVQMEMNLNCVFPLFFLHLLYFIAAVIIEPFLSPTV